VTARTGGDEILGRELAALAAELEWPPTPSIAEVVAARLAADPSRAGGWWHGGLRPARRALVLGFLAALVVIGLVAGIGFALGGLKIVFGGPPPGSPLQPALVVQRGFGQRTDLDGAAERLGGLLVPADPALGAPDHVYFDGPTRAVALAWGARPGLPADAESGLGVVVTEFRADITPGTFVKILHENALVERTAVRGAPAYWIAGGEHFFLFRGSNGEELDATIRLVGTTLMWEQDDLTLRIEGAPTLADAVRIAESMQARAAP
jgi:hypothetical protein